MMILYTWTDGSQFPQSGVPVHSITPAWILGGSMDDAIGGQDLVNVIQQLLAAQSIIDVSA